MPSGPHLTQLCVALSRLQSVYCPRDRELLAEYSTIQGRSIDDTAERMIALSRGLVLKIYTQTIRSDQKWSHQEQELGAYILCEFWGQQLDGEAFRTAWARLMSDSIKLTWDSLLTPFIHCRSLSHLRSEVFTTAMHIANLFAKCDGLIDPEETQTILRIEHTRQSCEYGDPRALQMSKLPKANYWGGRSSFARSPVPCLQDETGAQSTKGRRMVSQIDFCQI